MSYEMMKERVELAEIRECPGCGKIFNFNGLRDVCASCFNEEEKKFEEVYRFMRRRENRAATMEQIEEQIGVEKDLIQKWVRKGRLQPALFPNLGYPCDRCGALTQTGKLCDRCKSEIESELNQIQAAEELREAFNADGQGTYHRKR